MGRSSTNSVSRYRKSQANSTVANKSARIRTRYTKAGRLRTETVGRDPGTLRVALSTDERNNSTFMTISRGDETIHLSGREALTVFRTAQQHRSLKTYQSPGFEQVDENEDDLVYGDSNGMFQDEEELVIETSSSSSSPAWVNRRKNGSSRR